MSGQVERRQNFLTKEDVKELLDAAVDKHMTSDAHQFVQAWMQKEQRKQELWEKAKAHVLGWGAVTIVVFLFTILKEHFTK